MNYTDLEIAEYDTPTGRPELCDMIASHGLWGKIMGIIEEDLKQVNGICDLLVYGARKTFEQKHSLEYRMNKVFASLLGTEDLAETIAKAEGLNSKLIDLFGMVRNEEKKPGEGTGLRFDKRDN